MNYKEHPYPSVEGLAYDCKQISLELENQLNSNDCAKIFLNDIYKIKDGKCKANRNALRNAFACNSMNSKYPGKEIKGVYVFVDPETNKPFYVGISQTIIRRLKQHVFGKTHNHATLTYLLARHTYEKKEGKPHKGTRADLDYFTNHRESIQERLRKSRVLIKEIDNNFLMHAVEVYLACHYKTVWNCFETH